MSPTRGTEANTFSIVTRCDRTGEFGVAVASAVPAVGSICPFVRAGVGAVSTQSWVNPYLAVRILDAMQAGSDAQPALNEALAGDDEANLRQVGVVDASGGSASWTGADCTQWHGEVKGRNFAAQGNMLTGGQVLSAMAETFQKTIGEPLEDRLMACLEAAQAAGGDKRGRQSAALVVIGGEAYAKLDVRVDEDPDPIPRLRRTFDVAKAQLLPFIAGMPKREGGSAFPPEVMDLLLLSPPDRPAGGGSSIP
jgi:uncharacterized Ntn-hydrolase superfamily protein